MDFDNSSTPDLILKILAPTPEERVRSIRQKAIYEAETEDKRRLEIEKKILEMTFSLRAIGMSFDELAEFFARHWNVNRATVAHNMIDEYKKRGGK